MESYLKETSDGFVISKSFLIRLGIDSNFESNWVDSYALANIALENSFRQPINLQLNLNLLDIAKSMNSNFAKPFIDHSFRTLVIKNYFDSQLCEFDIHQLFKKGYKELLGNDVKLVNRPNDPKHIPDFWILENDEYIPVEIKLHSFDARHLRQLKRYMSFYKSPEGIAVARDLNCELPKNIRFITYKKLEAIK